MVDRSGPTGVPRSPIRWQLPHSIGRDQNSRSPRPRSPCECQDGPGPRVRAELPLLPPVRRQIALEQVADRARRAASPLRPAPRLARRRPARRGRASAPSASPTSGWSTGSLAARHPGPDSPVPRPGPSRRSTAPIRSSPASSGRSEPMCGIRSRPNLAMRKYSVLAYGSPGLMMLASGSPKSPRDGADADRLHLGDPRARTGAAAGPTRRRGRNGSARNWHGGRPGPGASSGWPSSVGSASRRSRAAEAASNGGSGLAVVRRPGG